MGSGMSKPHPKPVSHVAAIHKIQSKMSKNFNLIEKNPKDLPYEVVSCYKTDLKRKEKQLSESVYKNFGKILLHGSEKSLNIIKNSQTVSNGSTDLNC
jgi:hypothetical protein